MSENEFRQMCLKLMETCRAAYLTVIDREGSVLAEEGRNPLDTRRSVRHQFEDRSLQRTAASGSAAGE